MKSLAIVGAAGRMGQTMAQHLSARAEFTVTALVDVNEPSQLYGAPWYRSIAEVTPGSVDVVVDFSSPDGVVASAAWCANHGRGLVIGTTGLTDSQRGEIATAAQRTGVALVSNFSLGAVLADRFAALAAPFFEAVEIVELHHDGKRDAPSGTSLATARAIAASRAKAGAAGLVDQTERHSLEGARGGRGDGGVPIHSVRLPGLVAHQEILFGGPGEGLSIRHDSYDRVSFVAGVALAALALDATPRLVTDMGELVFPASS